MFLDTLKEALTHELTGMKSHPGTYIGWCWYDVHTSVHTLNRLVTDKILNISYQSRSGCYYKLANQSAVKDAIEMTLSETGSSNSPVPSLAPTPADLFDPIIGHEKEKIVARYALECDKPVHLLFQGKPASAKTLFLMEMSNLPESYYCLAQTLTGAGLAEVLFSHQPKILLVDEIDRLSGDNVGTLNSLMATGVITETKYGKTRSAKLSTKVMAAGIHLQKLPNDLLSRFIVIRFPVYTENEFINVCLKLLPREGLKDTDLCKHVAVKCWTLFGMETDIRKAVQIARLGGGDLMKINMILDIMKERR